MTFGSTFGRTFSPTFQPRSQAAAASSWWLSGGIAAANCIAAYQPKGAADYAASKVNLANPGTYNAVDGAAYPTWNTTDGWIFTNSGQTYLDTTYIPPNSPTGTWAIKYSNAAQSAWYAFGVRTAGVSTVHMFRPDNSSVSNSGAAVNDSTFRSSGVMVLAGTSVYYNGTDLELTTNSGSGTPTHSVYIGCRNDRGVAAGFNDIKIQAFCRYSIVLTIEQSILLTNAMNAL